MSSPSLPPLGSPSSTRSSESESPISPDFDLTDEGHGGAPVDDTSQDGGDARPAGGRRRLTVLTALVVALLGVAGMAVYVATNEQTPPPKPDIPLDAWVPYWALDASLPDAPQRVPSMREVSPFWFNAVGVDQIVVDPNASAELTTEFMDTVRGLDVDVVPSIIDAMPAGAMAAILADPAARGQHVGAIRAFAAEGDYDGIDIDYEQFAFADGRDTWATTRPNWVSFIEELAAALRADGRSLTVSIPPVYDADRTSESGYWVYDYGAIVEHVDRIRMMTYDYSVSEPGPIAPLDWVESAITGAIEATGSPEKLVLGLPAYGRNWPVRTTGVCPSEGVQDRTSVSARSVDDLIERRVATPIPVDDTGEWEFEYDLEVSDGTTTCVQTRQVHYVDGDGIALRMDLARQYRLGGVALWAFGFDDDAVWEAILPTVADPNATTATE
ncbi:MAG TPA: glycosyl hydrolase family 18 protein [Ilumatobacteraceae bacterium]|nr:glycosyl hydrolase family 18 protein [Ilumatobacteraceae bacterium]